MRAHFAIARTPLPIPASPLPPRQSKLRLSSPDFSEFGMGGRDEIICHGVEATTLYAMRLPSVTQVSLSYDGSSVGASGASRKPTAEFW